MAKVSLGAVADRVFRDVMAPLVLGGDLVAGRPIGARAALAVGVARDRSVADPELIAHVDLARIRVARRLVAVDHVEAASVHEWALAVVLHDLVQSTNPRLPSLLRASAPAKLIAHVDAALEHVPQVTSVREALARHTWFSRLFEIARTDTVVSWWTGSQTFLGTTPSARLAAWPELRRVHVDTTSRPLTELPTAGGGVDPALYEQSLAAFLARTPLTDLATLARATPEFRWTAATLALASTRGGSTLAQRAMARASTEAVDHALGRATRALVAGKAGQPAMVALELLADRALAAAEAVLAKGVKGATLPREAAPTDGSFARAAGAIVAQRRLLGAAHGLTEDDRTRILGVLEPALVSASAGELKALLT